MLLLDTDHVVEYQKGTSEKSRHLKERLDAAAEPFGTTIITVEEIMRRLDGGHSPNARSTRSD